VRWCGTNRYSTQNTPEAKSYTGSHIAVAKCETSLPGTCTTSKNSLFHKSHRYYVPVLQEPFFLFLSSTSAELHCRPRPIYHSIDYKKSYTSKRSRKKMNLFTPTKRASTTPSANLTPVSPIATEVSFVLREPQLASKSMFFLLI
jgi:hypothetical protein